MTTSFQEPCRFRAQQHGLIVLLNQLLKLLALGLRQRLLLLFEVESFELRSGIAGEAILGGTPQLLVVQKLEIPQSLGQVARQLLPIRGSRGHRVQKLRFQTSVGTLCPTLEKIVKRGWQSKRYCVSGHGSSSELLTS